MITSRSNPKILDAVKLRKKRNRKKRGEYLIEGIKLLDEAIQNGVPVKEIFLTEQAFERYSDELEEFDYEIVSVPVIEKLSTLVSPEGIVAIVEQEENTLDFKTNTIYLDNIRDPGNLGTILRTADAAGYKQVLLSESCVDVYNEKVLRGAMGSFFRLSTPVVTPACLHTFKDDGFSIIASDLEGENLDFKNLQIPEKFVLVFGNESNGIGEEVLDICSQFVKIPIVGGAESLNVSVAAGIIMYAYANL